MVNQVNSNLVMDPDFYKNNQNYNTGCDSARALAQSSLFGRNVTDCADAVDKLIRNDKWKINMDADGDGTMENVNLADAVAASFDSELDLYIWETVTQIMQEYGTCSKSYLGEKALAALREKGIVVEAVGSDESNTNRVYTFSLVDENGNVLQDSNGKKGSVIFADCLIPDGFAQGAEQNLASILDQMGYDCVTKADFIGNEDKYFEVIRQVEQNIQNGVYTATEGLDSLYGNRKDIRTAVSNLWGGSGPAPGMYGAHSSSGTASITEQREVESEQREEDDQRKQYYDELMAQEVQSYKDAHDGQEPVGLDYDVIDARVQQQVRAKYGN